MRLFNVQDTFFMALIRRDKPVRELIIDSCHIGEGNFDALCRFARRGLITEKLTMKGA